MLRSEDYHGQRRLRSSGLRLRPCDGAGCTWQRFSGASLDGPELPWLRRIPRVMPSPRCDRQGRPLSWQGDRRGDMSGPALTSRVAASLMRWRLGALRRDQRPRACLGAVCKAQLRCDYGGQLLWSPTSRVHCGGDASSDRVATRRNDAPSEPNWTSGSPQLRSVTVGTGCSPPCRHPAAFPRRPLRGAGTAASRTGR